MIPAFRKFATQAPENYTAGLGRGAVGFITRSDIGPSRTAPNPLQFGQQPQQQYVPGFGRGAQAFNKEEMEGDQEQGDFSENKFDEWSGYSAPLFNFGDMDQEDREAEQIYFSIDQYMDGRRRTRREKKFEAQLKKFRDERPSIAQQNANLKRNLAHLSYDDWMSIPEIGDYTVKKVKRDKYIPVPDSIIETQRKEGEMTSSIGVEQGGTQTSLMSLNEVGEARGTLLGIKLDKISDSVTGQSNVDVKGYITDLNSLPVNSSADISDFKKARLLLKSVINTNSKYGSGWIAAARVEELDGKLQAARNILAQGLENCPDFEDLWLEAIRLETPLKSKEILAKAIQQIPKSIKLWMAAVQREQDKLIKIKILTKALDSIPNSVKLWKELIELSDEGEAKVLLHRAVECVPHCLEMWLALAKLETYENAKVVLNQARKALPMEQSIWIHAAKLEETQHQNPKIVDNFLSRAIKVLQMNQVRIKREEWLQEAVLAEKSENIMTCRAIIKYTIGEGLDEVDKERVWLEDADQLEQKGNFESARAVHEQLVELFANNKAVWLRCIEFERRQEQIDSKNQSRLDQMIENARDNCQKEDIFWLMLAKRKWQQGKLDEARDVLHNAKQKVPSKEKVYMALSKFEKEIGQLDKAQEILKEAREVCPHLKIWMRSIKLERLRGDFEIAQMLAEEATKKYPLHEKIWILAASLKTNQNQPQKALQLYEKGLEFCKNSQLLWLSYINFEIQQGNFGRARSLIEKAKTKLQNSDDLSLLSIYLEEQAQNLKGVRFLLNKAIQQSPKNGLLWAKAIELEPKTTRKAKIVDALKQCENDPDVLVAVSKLFWKDKKFEKAKKWLERALVLSPNNGDAWACYFYLVEEIEPESAPKIKKQCLEQNPREGQMWVKIKKGLEGWKLNNTQVLDMMGKIIKDQIQAFE